MNPRPIKPSPPLNLQPRNPHPTLNPPLITLANDVHEAVRRAALEEAKKAVTNGLQSGQSIDAIRLAALEKAQQAAEEMNRLSGNVLQTTEIVAIASAVTEEALRQYKRNSQQPG